MMECKKSKCEKCNKLCKVKLVCYRTCTKSKDKLFIDENGDIIVCDSCVYSSELEELMHLENAVESLKEDPERNDLSIITIVEKMKEISDKCAEIHKRLVRVRDLGILTIPGIDEELRLYEALTNDEKSKITRVEIPNDFVFYSKTLSRFTLGKEGIVFCGLVIKTELDQTALEKCAKIFKRKNLDKKEIELESDKDYFFN